jgi:hypothetical protein
MVKLYHYTSAKGCQWILVDGVIRRSRGTTGDAVLGHGVYLTAQPPWTKYMKILKNNWAGGSEQAILSKLDNLHYCIEFDSEDLPGVVRSLGTRDIWMVSYDIDLEDVPHKTFVREHNIAVARRRGCL